VVADFVLGERLDYVPPAPPLEGAALFSHNFKSGANPLMGENLRHTLGRVITLGKNIILSIKP
jgi:hypothetical protein